MGPTKQTENSKETRHVQIDSVCITDNSWLLCKEYRCYVIIMVGSAHNHSNWLVQLFTKICRDILK
jgi:hypothetical protein